MSIEAFLWNYQDGEPIGFDFVTVRDLLSTDETEWLDEYGCLRVQFTDPNDCVDIFLGRNSTTTNHIDGIMVARPTGHPEFLRRIFRVMQLGNVVLFYSDETTPVFVRGAEPCHYPDDLLQALGEPRYADTPDGLLHQT